MQNCTEVYLTDKTGNKFFKTLCSAEYAAPEVRNLTRKIEEAKQHPNVYSFLDIDTARVEQKAVSVGS